MADRQLKRNNFFAGKLLAAEDLTSEQDYFLGKQRRHNRLLHGRGIVSGLEVSASGDSLTVSQGFALDGLGNEILLPEPYSLQLKRDPCAHLYLTLKYAEKRVAPTPTSVEDEVVYAFIEDAFEIGLSPAQSAEGEPSVVILAALTRTSESWIVDESVRRYVLSEGREPGGRAKVFAGALLGLMCGLLIGAQYRRR
jgi:hypothetical protein